MLWLYTNVLDLCMKTKTLTVLICTHNRAELLQRALDSLQLASRPTDWHICILVAANACTDSSHQLLEEKKSAAQKDSSQLPLNWISEPKPGKSFALNTAIPLIKSSDVIAFVDDDHRVDTHFLTAICTAADNNPNIDMFCGRILPEWDGTEPSWVHDEGPYKIRPLPIPRSDGGPTEKELTENDRTPGGGNLSIRGKVFDNVGTFSTELGPHGHDLGGGEDSAFIHTALSKGHRLIYIPDIVQYHHVDHSRLKFGYVLRKAYHRARSDAAMKNIRSGMPAYLWRKLAQHLTLTIFAFSISRFRFFLLRSAATLGEMDGIRSTKFKRSTRPVEKRRNIRFSIGMLAMLVTGITASLVSNSNNFVLGFGAVLFTATGFTLLIAVKSIVDFSHTGPRLNKEIFGHYRLYALMALLRLLGFSFLILCTLASLGVISYFSIATLSGWSPNILYSVIAASGTILALSALQFSRQLLFLPASIAISYNYRISRLYPFWRTLSPKRLRIATWLALGSPALLVSITTANMLVINNFTSALAFGSAIVFFLLLAMWLRPSEAKAKKHNSTYSQPNIIMIGSDTLRSDRLDGSYEKNIAPYLKQLREQGTFFSQCHVPCARTAPSLISMLTGCWPHRFGVRDNFVPDATTNLTVKTLPQTLTEHGYQTATLSDWCGADMAKFSMGFDYTDVPEDQWNIKLFIRQGPKDLRLFLSLFSQNHLGKCYLPEIFYLGGIPQTNTVGREARHLINHLAEEDQPFLLNVFLSTTHGPFGSEYPYYTRYSTPDYDGESKFIMSRVSDPWEIIRRQGEPKEEFDLEQIINLYDGSVTRFDDEIRRTMAHLEQSGLTENTIVVIYSDHGMEFFEHDTWGQGNSAISDVSSRIPLLITGPGLPQSRYITQPVRSIDITPTLLDLVGIKPADNMDGISLKPGILDSCIETNLDIYNETGIWLTDLPGMPKDHLRYPKLLELLTVRNIVTGTISIKPEFENLVIHAKDRMIRAGKWKLVYQPLQESFLLRLFNLEQDSSCLNDISGNHPEVVTMLWKKLSCIMESDLRQPPKIEQTK